MADNTALAAANQEEKNFNETLKSSLRKMIKSCDTYIKEAKNMEQLQDNLKHMEEIDENFHKLYSNLNKNKTYYINNLMSIVDMSWCRY